MQLNNTRGFYHHVRVVYNGVDIVCCLDERKASMSEGNDTCVHAYAFNEKKNLYWYFVEVNAMFYHVQNSNGHKSHMSKVCTEFNWNEIGIFQKVWDSRWSYAFKKRKGLLMLNMTNPSKYFQQLHKNVWLITVIYELPSRGITAPKNCSSSWKWFSCRVSRSFCNTSWGTCVQKQPLF